ncbi:hypothetical protein H0X09_01655 [Candidatus Saccharibacteria bacterium]|nr:hypothetical protein [Candidatus Saccharibacteria bacterium]
MRAKKYAQIVGVTLLIIAALGFALGEEPLLGILNIDIQEDLIHLFSGGLMALVGFKKSEKVASTVVGLLGAVYLFVGIAGVISPGLLGFLRHDYSLLDNLIHLSLGVAGLGVYFISNSRQKTQLS